MKKLISSLALSLLTISISHADEKTLQNKLDQTYPELHAQVTGKSPISGIYEVMVEGELTYTDDNGRYFFIGNLIDYPNKRSVSQQRMQELSRIDVKKLPLTQAIKHVKGNGQRVLYIFTDPDCPYCKQLEKDLTQVNNITLYIFPYPITALHPNAATTAQKIWCSAKPYEAWQSYVLQDKQPTGSTNCKNPIEANSQLGKQLGVDGTPTFFLKDGQRISGARSAQQIEQLLNTVK
ncbi:DsbC family protein [Acinetobacter qingfengensis]|uniref:Thiol:disulfide interchange protein n=1 Tax=Acinetobacter qingfengensis TaxID=1262585 RepID=A0A1E7RFC2_9GAMM|nr:DsbC family protein [Acinetobacter qingfengensis]KAA8732787.1 DsbC family protein [Acinetobacter qingfengensis]OEY98100.1 thiol:disulfide interchange protein [Acinetobacter qingfengensis]